MTDRDWGVTHLCSIVTMNSRWGGKGSEPLPSEPESDSTAISRSGRRGWGPYRYATIVNRSPHGFPRVQPHSIRWSLQELTSAGICRYKRLEPGVWGTLGGKHAMTAAPCRTGPLAREPGSNYRRDGCPSPLEGKAGVPSCKVRTPCNAPASPARRPRSPLSPLRV